MRRVWTSLGVGLGLLVLGVPGWIAYHSRDLASVDESGLLVEDGPRLLPAENAAVPLAHAARLLDWPSGEGAMERVRDIRNKAGSDSESARALVRRNEGALESLRQAMLIREIEISAEELLPTGNSPGVSPFVLWLRLLEIHHVQGALRMAEGDGEGAYQDALIGLRLADRLHSSRGAALPHALLAISLGDSALLQLRVLLPGGTVDRVSARRLIGAIEDSRLDPDGWARIWAGEYRLLRAVYTEEIQSKASPAFVPTSYVSIPTAPCSVWRACTESSRATRGSSAPSSKCSRASSRTAGSSFSGSYSNRTASETSCTRRWSRRSVTNATVATSHHPLLQSRSRSRSKRTSTPKASCRFLCPSWSPSSSTRSPVTASVASRFATLAPRGRST